jgi:hypothetical protein
MWAGKGRSGIGDTNTQGTWEDWDGLSPNGRQYKNAITQETRNLSGQEYWNARKADYPSQSKQLHIVNGKANTDLYRGEQPKKKQENIRHLISPATKALDTLDDLELKLEKQFKQELLDFDSYSELKNALEIKREKAWVRYEKEQGTYEAPPKSIIKKPRVSIPKERKAYREAPKSLQQPGYATHVSPIERIYRLSQRHRIISACIFWVLGVSLLVMNANTA